MENNLNCDLIIKTKIWDSDNHELVDYDNPNIVKKIIKINSSGILSRVKDEIIFSKEKNISKQLLTVKKDERNFNYMINCGNWSPDLNILSNEKGAFMVYKSSLFKEPKNVKNKFYKLNQGDIIKLGRVYLKLLDYEIEEEVTHSKDSKVKESNSNKEKSLIKNFSFNSSVNKGNEVIKGTFFNDKKKKFSSDLSSFNILRENNFLLSNRNKSNNSKIKNNFFLPRINSSEELFTLKSKKKIKKRNFKKNVFNNFEKQQKKVCRICYGEESTEENPLIYPCICKGSMKYIHYLCLKNWMNSKIEAEIEQNENDSDSTISYNTKDICCELCKTQFPDYIRYKDQLYNISFYKPKFKEFIVFESLRINKHNNCKTRYFNIISLDNKKIINIGRANECNFSIPEISMSRFHSLIHKVKGELYIEDNKSKFGTLILVQNDKIEINNYLPLKLQIDKTYIKIKKDLPFFYSCCNSFTIEDKKADYQEQNQEFLNVFSYFNVKNNYENDNDSESSIEIKDSSLSDSKNKNNKSIKDSMSNDINRKNKLEDNFDNIDENKSSKNCKSKNNNESDNNSNNKKDNESNKNIIEINNINKDNKENKKITNLEIYDNNDNHSNFNNLKNNNNYYILNSNRNNESNIQIYRKNNNNTLTKNGSITNNNSKTIINDFDNDTLTIKIKKKNRINLMFEDCNNKNSILKNDGNSIISKAMRKIKIVKNGKNKHELLLPDINELNKEYIKIKPLENLIQSPIKMSHLKINKNNRLTSLYLKETNMNIYKNNIFNINKPKISINKNNLFCFNSFQILDSNKNKSNESQKNIHIIQKEKTDREKVDK